MNHQSPWSPERRFLANHEFEAVVQHPLPSTNVNREEIYSGLPLTKLFLGMAIRHNSSDEINIAFSCHDFTYMVDFAVHTITAQGADATNVPLDEGALADHVVNTVRAYEKSHMCKFVAVGMPAGLLTSSPEMPSRLWLELDILPVVFHHSDCGSSSRPLGSMGIGIDESADSMARKCMMYFGPSYQPRVLVGFHNQVEVDLSDRIGLATMEDHERSVSTQTWDTALAYARSLRNRRIKIAFFSATPQGGGVALMRHALIRFYRLIGVDCTWWVPKPKPEVFCITKTNHNILQGVAEPHERFSTEQEMAVNEWTFSNAERFWAVPGGPLMPRSQGGAQVVIVDDPQMPCIIDIAKQMEPDRPVIFRSHIQVRADLADQDGTPTSRVWKWVWRSVQQADVFISHPVAGFVPSTVDRKTLGYMPATTDWLDGLNKTMTDVHTAYYLKEFNLECVRQGMTTLAYPKRDYIVQIARFDPSKGIPTVLASYAEFRRKSRFCAMMKVEDTPQLVVAGHSSIDDPDGVRVLAETLALLDREYPDIKDSIVVMRLGPTDQILNALLSNARVALQLSTREGFEVKVSEALHKGVPVIATTAGGIPLQIEHGKSGFLVRPGDAEAVSNYLDVLFGDEAKYREMSEYAASHVSDEVSTVGNAINWMYLADQLLQGRKVEPCGQWVWDLAREAAGEPRVEGEVWLPRGRAT
jgi:glycosyltransferase involved in cell wall biosynthesis